MKKIYSLLATVLVAAGISAQAFTATYEFAGTPPTSVGVVAGTGSTNVAAGNFSATVYSPTGTANRYAHSGATTSTTPNLNQYFSVTITPNAGVNLSISSVGFRTQRSGTGPRSYIVRSSADSYATNLPASIVPANSELEVIATDVFHFVNDCSSCSGQNGNTATTSISDVTTPVTFRFYFFDSESTGGTFSVDDVVITGSATSGSLSVSENFTAKLSNFIKNTLVKNNEIVFGSDVKDIKVYTLSGAVVKTGSVKNGSTLNVAELAKGNYIVTGIVNNEPVSQKILKD